MAFQSQPVEDFKFRVTLRLASQQRQTYKDLCVSHLNRSCMLVRVLQEPKQRGLGHTDAETPPCLTAICMDVPNFGHPAAKSFS